MPHVLKIGRISEGQNSVFFVDRKDGSNLDGIFLNYMRSGGASVLLASSTCPGHWVFFTANFEGVEKSDLVLEGKGECDTSQGG